MVSGLYGEVVVGVVLSGSDDTNGSLQDSPPNARWRCGNFAAGT